MSEKKFLVSECAFRNPDIPVDDRIDDLISRLTLEEKISLIPTKQAAVERLGIKEYTVGGEAAHGWVSRTGDKATVFPQNIGLACSWDVDLLQRIGSAIGDEARAYHNIKNTGLTLWAPTVDMERDPRWGRTEEAYGEDPYLSGEMASAFVRGMQGPDSYYLKVSTALKHFFANNNEKDRGFCSASIDPRNMREYYWKPFEIVIKKSAATCLMTAYNEVNGTPCILNKDVKNIVKAEWGLPGFVVGDGNDFSQLVSLHKYFNNHVESIADTIKSGVDCIPDNVELIKKSLKSAIAKGFLEEEDLNQALKNIFRIRFRLGEFDPTDLNPYAKIGKKVISCKEHRELALEAAQKSIVLLKNQNNFLPLNRDKLKKIAVIGPLADEVYRDWYTGVLPYKVTPLEGLKKKLKEKEINFVKGSDKIAIKSSLSGKYISPEKDSGSLFINKDILSNKEFFEINDWGWGSFTLKSIYSNKYLRTDDEIRVGADDVYGWFVKELFNIIPDTDDSYLIKTWDNRFITIDENKRLVPGSVSGENTDLNKFKIEKVEDGLAEAVKAAEEADLAIVFLGNHPLINGKEEIDREDIVLPPVQEELAKRVFKSNPNTLVVLISSYPMAVNWLEENIPAIIYSSHGGQELGNAIADVLAGDYNPAGRLNMTWYSSIEQLPDIMDYDIIRSKRTYMYFDGEPLYPFGHGLSYTDFKYSDLYLYNKKIKDKELLELSIKISNIGKYSGDEVVQLYVKSGKSKVIKPQKELKGFKRVYLEPGESIDMSFSLSADELKYWNVDQSRYFLESGKYKVMLGSSSEDIRIEEEFEVIGEYQLPRDLSIMTLAQNFDDYNGIILDEITENKETGVKFRKDDDWIGFYNVEFENGINCLQLITFNDKSRVTYLEIRLDSPEGEMIGICRVEGKNISKKRIPVKNINGIHDIYFKSRGELGLYKFCFLNRGSSGVKYL